MREIVRALGAELIEENNLAGRFKAALDIERAAHAEEVARLKLEILEQAAKHADCCVDREEMARLEREVDDYAHSLHDFLRDSDGRSPGKVLEELNQLKDHHRQVTNGHCSVIDG